MKFALSMIVRNGASTLPRLLDGVATVFDQIVIVDTGSTDGTVELLKEKYRNVQVHKFEWIDDFSAARNFSLRHLDRDVDAWMWLDADDVATPATAKAWRKLAEKHLHLSTTYIHLPYWYAIERDKPTLLQYRERIMFGTAANWEWREVIHEVCCSKENKTVPYKCNALAVKHFPNGVGKSDRNWKILLHSYLKGGRDTRLCYYLLKDAVGRGLYDLASAIGTPEFMLNQAGYFKYECLKFLGITYQKLWERDKVPFYKEEAERHFREAIEVFPAFNEAREDLIWFLVSTDRALLALDEVSQMATEAPDTSYGISMDSYDPAYIHAISAQIRLSTMGLDHDGLQEHLLSVDSERPPKRAFTNDQRIRQLMEQGDIGLVCCKDDKDLLFAREYANKLCTEGVFREVLVTQNPLAIQFGRKVYHHIGDEETDGYVDDAPLQCRKVWIHTPDSVWFERHRPVGWEVYLHTGVMSEAHLYREIFEKYEYVVAESIEQALLLAKASHKEVFVASFMDFVLTGMDAYAFPVNKITLFTNNKGDVIGLGGHVATLNEFMARKNTLFLRGTKDVVNEKMPTASEGLGWVGFDVRKNPKDTIVFAANGLEEWDGTTPHKWGIGASESSVVALAEEFYHKGYEVFVYNTVTTRRIVGGVTYLPLGELPAQANWDLFIASRMPQLLSTRRAKKQVLWAHDVIEAYDLSRATEMDELVCVSEWQWRKTKALGASSSLTKVIHNGVHKADQRQMPFWFGDSYVWASQPERGLEDLLEIRRQVDGNPRLWVLYGFQNALRASPGKSCVFLDTLRLKWRLRLNEAYLVGRVPIQTMRAIMMEAGALVYPSSFPETFCVTVVEALQCGLPCFINENGATADTALLADETECLVYLPASKEDYVAKRDKRRWAAWLSDRVPGKVRKKVGVNDELYWENVVREWLKLL